MGKRTVTQYTLDFKQSSAKLAIESEQSISQTAKDLGINANTLHGWVNRYHPKIQLTTKNTSSVELLEENKRLKKENARLKKERDIFKKASAYFASEMS